MTGEAYKDTTHNTNIDSHEHIGDDIVFAKDKYSVKYKKQLNEIEYKTIREGEELIP